MTSKVRVLLPPPAFARFASFGWASQRGSLVANERRLPRRSPQGEGGLFKRFASFGWASQHGSLVANERRLPRRSPQGEGGLFKRFASFGC
jgi:hypothetical protein